MSVVDTNGTALAVSIVITGPGVQRSDGTSFIRSLVASHHSSNAWIILQIRHGVEEIPSTRMQIVLRTIEYPTLSLGIHHPHCSERTDTEILSMSRLRNVANTLPDSLDAGERHEGSPKA